MHIVLLVSNCRLLHTLQFVLSINSDSLHVPLLLIKRCILLPSLRGRRRGRAFSFALHYIFVLPTLILRLSYVHPPLCLRFVNEGRSSSQRRMIEFTTKDERRMNEGRTEEYGDVTILEWGNMPKSALFVFLSHYLFDMLVYSVDLGYICICLIPLYIYIA